MSRISLVSIIDDDQIFQFTAKRILDSTGLTEKILQFADGEKAFEYFNENRNNPELLPDLVFLDLNMPYMDGWGFLKKFTSTQFKKDLIPIYICTSSDSIFDRERFETFTNLKGYLIKPVSKAKFLEVVQTELGLI